MVQPLRRSLVRNTAPRILYFRFREFRDRIIISITSLTIPVKYIICQNFYSAAYAVQKNNLIYVMHAHMHLQILPGVKLLVAYITVHFIATFVRVHMYGAVVNRYQLITYWTQELVVACYITPRCIYGWLYWTRSVKIVCYLIIIFLSFTIINQWLSVTFLA